VKEPVTWIISGFWIVTATVVHQNVELKTLGGVQDLLICDVYSADELMNDRFL
jgi:hypothetical protein